MYDVTYEEIQFNCSRLCNFTSLWKMVKNTVKLHYRFFFHKSNQKFKENQGWHVLYIHEYDVTYAECKTSWNLVKSPQNFVQHSFSMQLPKIWHKNRGKALASIPFEIKKQNTLNRIKKANVLHTIRSTYNMLHLVYLCYHDRLVLTIDLPFSISRINYISMIYFIDPSINTITSKGWAVPSPCILLQG